MYDRTKEISNFFSPNKFLRYFFIIFCSYGDKFSCMNITWWDALDIIGVDAYFPIANFTTEPTYDEIKKSWKPIVAGKTWEKKMR